MITAFFCVFLLVAPQEDPRTPPKPPPPPVAPAVGTAPAPPASNPTGQAAPPARPEDVATVDAIIAALYASISGPKGAPRDFDRLRSLFATDAKLISLGQPDGRYRPRMMSVDGYLSASGKFLVEMGFTERELHRREDRFGHLVHVWSTYEGRIEGPDSPLVRGINSLQLAHDGTRFWILSLVWDPESPSNPLPPSALPPAAPPK